MFGKSVRHIDYPLNGFAGPFYWQSLSDCANNARMIGSLFAFMENLAFVGNNAQRTIGRVQLARLLRLTTCFRTSALIVTSVSATNGVALKLKSFEHVSYSRDEGVGNLHVLDPSHRFDCGRFSSLLRDDSRFQVKAKYPSPEPDSLTMRWYLFLEEYPCGVCNYFNSYPHALWRIYLLQFFNSTT